MRIWPTMLKADVICVSHDYFLLLKIMGTILFHYIPLEIKEIFHMPGMSASFIQEKHSI